MNKQKRTIEELLEEALVTVEEHSEVPENWIYFYFTSILDISGGTQPPKSQFISEPKEGYIRLVQIRDFASNDYPTYIPFKKNLRVIEEDDILIARYGASVGRILTGLSGAYNVALAKVTYPKNIIDRKYLFWLLHTEHFQSPLRAISRSAQAGFNKNDLSYFKMPLPPLKEQKRIAEKVERLLGKIEEAKRLINYIPELSENFKKKIISAACEGDLTRDWREGQLDVEDAMKLLEKLFNKQEANGKVKKRNNSVEQEKVLHHIENWAITKIGLICEMQLGKMLSRKAYGENLIMLPYLRNANVQWGKVELSDVLEMGFKEEEIEKYSLKKGDLLVCEGGVVGRTAIWNEEITPCMYQKALHRLRCDKDLILPEWVYYFMLDSHNKGEFEKLTSQTTIRHLTQEKLKEVNIPVPPLKEQIEIVRRVERYISIVDELEIKYREIFNELLQAEKSILQKAFRGELETNDPSEDNAIELLKEVLQEQVK
ncbi:restriction endonuclease subunit S [Fictibacillus sp. FJAT-27399]|uniref:restriction endonuclease subunit S n=1 Tax=Fictibacillus sp. FJAT-27399 TaxID=1729689 RepID=UPI0007803577|nr:restriction endonuclease subunit S [Fictibacillus sp. FJAT-27399]